MTTGEQIAYDNGYIIGMASKGIIQKTIIIGGEKTLTWDKHDSFTSASAASMTLDYIPLEV